jgi:aryl-alcohol dehydrogenase-like predicted oxidoreductase
MAEPVDNFPARPASVALLPDVRTGLNAATAGIWTLGDRIVHRMGFGAMRLTSNADGSPSDRARAIGVLRRAVELGVNHIDTAAFYFSATRSANELINTALHPYADGLVITTKVGPGRGPDGEWQPLARPDQLRGQVEENLRQLGRDHLDVVNLRVHGLDDISEHFGALAELRTAGLIRHLGISNIRLPHLAQAQAVAPVVCVQNQYSLDYGRRYDDLVRACAEQAVAFVPFFAIATAAREAPADGTGHDAVDAVARGRGVSAAQVRLAWTLAQGPHMLAIPGTGDPRHLEENIAAGALQLTPEELTVLGG